MLGMDGQLAQGMSVTSEEFQKLQAEYASAYGTLGVNVNDAAEQAHLFQNTLNQLKQTFSVITDAVGISFFQESVQAFQDLRRILIENIGKIALVLKSLMGMLMAVVKSFVALGKTALEVVSSIIDWYTRQSTLFQGIIKIIGGIAMNLMVPVLSAYIAESIGKRPALVPGFVAGMISIQGLPVNAETGLIDAGGAGVGFGFLGGIIGGFLAGYVIVALEKVFSGLPQSLNGLKAMFLYPLCSTFIVGLIMLGISGPMAAINQGMMDFLQGLYNAGPAAGFLAFLIFCILYKSPGVPQPENTKLGDGYQLFVSVFFLVVFLLCLAAAYMMDKSCFKNYKALWKSDGYKTDYTEAFGMPVTLVNVGIYGLFILLYYNLVHGMTMVDGSLVFTGAKFTGATMGAIMCMMAFSAQGAQPRTVFPIMIGYAIASFLPFLMYVGGVVPEQSWTLTTQGILVGLCFASGLAPVAGKFGFFAGVLAGAVHAILVTTVPQLHGGFCLYNGGFTAGIVAFLVVPVLECFRRAKKEEAKE